MINEIQYIDFLPELKDRSFWGSKTYTTLDETLATANEWIRRNYNYEIINVETVVLPNAVKNGKLISTEVNQYYTGGQMVQNFQIIRIWYKQ